MDHDTSRLRSEAEAALRRLSAALDREIADYPTPISGCDAQFTHLLAERRRVGKARAALQSQVFIATPRTLRPGAGVESR